MTAFSGDGLLTQAVQSLVQATNANGAKLDDIIAALTTIATDIAAGPYFDYPTGATPITGASGNVANASAVATLAGAIGKTTYLAGFIITSGGATVGASIVTITVAGTVTSSLTFAYACLAGATVGNAVFAPTIPKPIPASATNTAITVTLPALGAGNTNASVVAFGYQR